MEADRIKQLREMKGITQTELAEAIGKSRSYICRIEAKNRDIKVTDLKKIADYFSCTIEYLMGRNK